MQSFADQNPRKKSGTEFLPFWNIRKNIREKFEESS